MLYVRGAAAGRVSLANARMMSEPMHAYLKHGKYFYTGSRFFVKLHGVPDDDIKEVTITENPAGDYYGWKDKNGEIKFIWPSEAQRDMCFPYGPKVEEDKGTGVRVRLTIATKEPQ